MKGFIYKITSPSTDKIYIGSTKQTLKARLNNHCMDFKRNKSCVSSSLILCFNDAVIECVEEVNFTERKELHSRERYYIELNSDKCVNTKIPTRTSKEYKIDNADKIKVIEREYNIANYEKRHKKFICECSGKYIYGKKQQHSKTNKHQKYISSII